MSQSLRQLHSSAPYVPALGRTPLRDEGCTRVRSEPPERSRRHWNEPAILGVSRRLAWLGCLAGTLSLVGCASRPPEPAPAPEPEEDALAAWERMITPSDRERLQRLPEAWTTALTQAREAGHAAELTALGALAEPTAGLPDPAPPPGRYRCRTIKIGGQGDLLDFIAYSWFECEITQDSDGKLRLDKLTGSQRQHGTLFPDTNTRMLFLGTLALGSEGSVPAYGTDPERDVVAALERFGPARWRLVQPWPYYESNLDLLELEPASAP